MLKWKEAHELGLWGTDAEQIVYAIFQAFAMANGKNAPSEFGLRDFQMYHEVQQRALRPRKYPTPEIDPFYSLAAQIRSFGEAQR